MTIIKSSYGLQVDAWGALLPDRASSEGSLLTDVGDALIEREIPNLTVTKEMVVFNETLGLGGLFGGKVSEVVKPREHLVIRQDLGDGGWATVALRVAQRGKDLEVSWRLFELNEKVAAAWRAAQMSLIIGGFAVFCIGIPFLVIGIGLVMDTIAPLMIAYGTGWWYMSRNRTTATTFQQFDSRVLAATVDYCLMTQLAKQGVTTHELRIIRGEQITGLGNLVATEPLQEMRVG
jgi:hypothetical protein